MADPRNAQPGSYGPSGYGAEGREQSRVALNPGRGRVRSNGPGAPNPAGWSPSPAGEAAPPVRHRGPARSDVPSPYDVETRPTGIYQVPWRSPRPANGQGPLRTPQPPVARPRRALPPPNRSLPAARRGFSDTPRNSPDAHGGAPDAPWPTLIRQAPRRIRVVGPIEALRSPASNLPAAPRGPVAGPAATQRPVARPEAGQRPAVVAPTDARRGRPGNTGVDVPRGGVPAPLSGSSTGWQLAQRAWEDSGAAWEAPAADSDDWYSAGLPTPDPYYTDYPGDYPTDYPGGLPATDPDDIFDTHPTRPDLPVLGDLAESRVGIGPWPVQTPPEAPQP